mgnify:CR=1 FL=1
MDISLNKKVNTKAVKAIEEFDLIEDGDQIAAGISGGKDSSFLLMVLSVLQKYSSKSFSLKAVHIDLGFKNSESNIEIKKICDKLNIDLKIIYTEISTYINNNKNNNPCSKCAHFRKGALINYLKENDFNKLAFGHHLDDAVETFLMSILYSGQLKTLQPKRKLSESKITIIRPLIYLREHKIQNQIEINNISLKSSLCPYDGDSARSKIRHNFKDYFEDEQLFSNLISAMRGKNKHELWPEELDYDLLSKKMKNFWK